MNRKKPLYTFMIAAWSVAWYVSLEKYLESDITIKDLITVLDDTKTKDKNLDFPGTERILDSLQRESEYRDKLIRQLKAETAALEVDLYTSKNYSYTKRNDGISGRWNVRYTHQDETTTKILDMLSGYDDADMWLYLDTLE